MFYFVFDTLEMLIMVSNVFTLRKKTGPALHRGPTRCYNDRPRRCSTSTNENIDAFKKIILEKHGITIREVVEDVAIYMCVAAE